MISAVVSSINRGSDYYNYYNYIKMPGQSNIDKILSYNTVSRQT